MCFWNSQRGLFHINTLASLTCSWCLLARTRRDFTTRQFSIASSNKVMSSQTPPMANVNLRPVNANDIDFLIEVYGSTRADEMAMVPWTKEQQLAFIKAQFSAQQDHYSKKYPTANHDIILSDDRPVGRLYVARLEDEIRIVDIT